MSPAKTPNPWPAAFNEHHEAVRRRAEEIYARNGKIPGHDLGNWAQAEQEILRESAARRAAVVIRVKDKEYVGEYDPATADGYRPGEFGPGASVLVTFNGHRMQVLRPNGKTLETTLLRRSTASIPDTKKTG